MLLKKWDEFKSFCKHDTVLFYYYGTDVNGKSSKEIFYRRLCQNQQCVNDSNTGILCSGKSGEH